MFKQQGVRVSIHLRFGCASDMYTAGIFYIWIYKENIHSQDTTSIIYVTFFINFFLMPVINLLFFLRLHDDDLLLRSPGECSRYYCNTSQVPVIILVFSLYSQQKRLMHISE